MSDKWQPIADLPPEFSALTDGELLPLAQFWSDQKRELHQIGRLQIFNQELAREWAIETGQIEGIYDIDRGTTRTLIERGINADLITRVRGQQPPELVAAIINSHLEVLDGLFDFVKGSRPLSKGYIHELHAALLRYQETAIAVDQFGAVFETQLIKGQYKNQPNNPTQPDGSVHVYCPPEHVDSEMERLIDLHAQHISQDVPVEIQSAWLHHRFAQIHPYRDGNGRVARVLASLVFIKAGWFPVVVTRDDRTRYIDALEVADQGALRPLVEFFVDLQKRSLFQATQAAADVFPANSVDEAVASIKKVLLGPGRSLDPQIWLRSKQTADHLIGIALERLKEVAALLSAEIGKDRPEFKFNASPQKSRRSEMELSYKPNLDDYDRGAALDMYSYSARSSSLEIYGHAIGSKFRGLIGIAAFYIPTGSEPSQVTSDGIFQVNYAESPESAERRFRPWLERAITQSLVLWRKTL
jgi:Fic family protein